MSIGYYTILVSNRAPYWILYICIRDLPYVLSIPCPNTHSLQAAELQEADQEKTKILHFRPQAKQAL